jgi:hypothetical protein
MTFSDAEIRILADTLTKHTGQHFDLAAADARTTIGSAYVAVDDPELLARLQTELEAQGIQLEEEADEMPAAQFKYVPLPAGASEAMADDAPSRGVSASVQEKLKQMRTHAEGTTRETITPLDALPTEMKVIFKTQLVAALDELRHEREPADVWHRVAKAFDTFRGGMSPVYTCWYELKPQPALRLFNSKSRRLSYIVVTHSPRDVSKELTEATGSPSEARAVVESVLQQIGSSRDAGTRVASLAQ